MILFNEASNRDAIEPLAFSIPSHFNPEYNFTRLIIETPSTDAHLAGHARARPHDFKRTLVPFGSLAGRRDLLLPCICGENVHIFRFVHCVFHPCDAVKASNAEGFRCSLC